MSSNPYNSDGEQLAAGGGRDAALIERQWELARVYGLIDAAAGGHGGILCVEGAAGIGKSALLLAAREYAASKALTVLSAACVEFERDTPYATARQLFGPTTRDDASPLLHGDASPPQEAPAGWRALYEKTVSLAAAGPLLICVDDLGWVDRDTERFLLYTARQLSELPVALIVAQRAGEARIIRDSAVDEWTPPEGAVVRPRPLSRDGLDELVRRRFPRPADAFVSALHEATGGNPYLARELLGHCRTASAAEATKIGNYSVQSIRRSAIQRAARVSPSTIDLLRALAVIGDNVTVSQLVAFAGADYSVTLETLDQLVRMDLIADEQTIAFRHPCVRAAIYGDVSPARRGEEHARAAELLMADGAPLARVVPHLLASTRRTVPWAVEALCRAARQALANDAPTAAVRCLRRALLEEPAGEERAMVLLELGKAEAHTSTARATDVLRAALGDAHTPVQRAEAAAELAGTLVRSERWREALGPVRTTRHEFRTLDESRQTTLLSDLYLAERLDLACGETAAQATAALFAELAGGARRPDSQALARLVGSLFSGSSCHAAALAARELLGMLTPTGMPSLGWACCVMTLAASGYLGRAQDELAAFSARQRHRGSLQSICIVSLSEANIALAAGSLADAEHAARTATLAAHKVGLPLIEPLARSALVDARLARGDVKGARGALSSYRPEIHSSSLTSLPFIAAYARQQAARGDCEGACELLVRAGRRAVSCGLTNPALSAWRSQAAQLHHRLGRDDAARELAEEELALARQFGAPRAIGVALQALGAISDGPQADAALREAVAALEAAGAAVEQARAMLELGARLQRAGQRKKAKALLRGGFELAERCGSIPLVERAHHEMRTMGIAPSGNSDAGIVVLTAAESRVAGLAAEGLSNADVAEQLSVTVKTVETHLTHAYRKLGIASRRELATALGRRAGVPPAPSLETLLESALEPMPG